MVPGDLDKYLHVKIKGGICYPNMEVSTIQFDGKLQLLQVSTLSVSLFMSDDINCKEKA